MYDAVAGFSVDAVNPFTDTSFPANEVFVDEVRDSDRQQQRCGQAAAANKLRTNMHLRAVALQMHCSWRLC
jgi:hypothetical protein